jgi:hypothetical protein
MTFSVKFSTQPSTNALRVSMRHKDFMAAGFHIDSRVSLSICEGHLVMTKSAGNSVGVPPRIVPKVKTEEWVQCVQKANQVVGWPLGATSHGVTVIDADFSFGKTISLKLPILHIPGNISQTLMPPPRPPLMPPPPPFAPPLPPMSTLESIRHHAAGLRINLIKAEKEGLNFRIKTDGKTFSIERQQEWVEI